MSMFNFLKKKESKEENAACCCGCACQTGDVTETAERSAQEKGDGSIKVLGSGCKNCRTLYDNTKDAVNMLGISETVEYITDMQKVMEYGVMSMPALVVNEKVVASGKVLKSDDIAALLKKQGF